MIVIWIALGIVLAVLILSNLGLIISLAAILVALVVLLGLGSLALDWVDHHPYDALALGLIAIVAFVFWMLRDFDVKGWFRLKYCGLKNSISGLMTIEGLKRAISLPKSFSQRERERRKKLGYDE